MKEKIKLKDLSDIEIIFYVQEINKPNADKKYTKEFMEEVHQEVLKRGS